MLSIVVQGGDGMPEQDWVHLHPGYLGSFHWSSRYLCRHGLFEMDLRQSICSYRLEYGEELRWIAPMAHWVYFVQPYKVDGWNYVTRLIDFVNGGMVDSDFVNLVGALS
jgi:hypothetical protein